VGASNLNYRIIKYSYYVVAYNTILITLIFLYRGMILKLPGVLGFGNFIDLLVVLPVLSIAPLHLLNQKENIYFSYIAVLGNLIFGFFITLAPIAYFFNL